MSCSAKAIKMLVGEEQLESSRCEFCHYHRPLAVKGQCEVAFTPRNAPCSTCVFTQSHPAKMIGKVSGIPTLGSQPPFSSGESIFSQMHRWQGATVGEFKPTTV